jgi:hypothetical protein
MAHARKISFEYYADSIESQERRDLSGEKLSETDFDALCAIVLDPPEPNEALKSGFRWYKSLIS